MNLAIYELDKDFNNAILCDRCAHENGVEDARTGTADQNATCDVCQLRGGATLQPGWEIDPRLDAWIDETVEDWDEEESSPYRPLADDNRWMKVWNDVWSKLDHYGC